MLKKNGSEVYPLQIKTAVLDGATYYDRDKRGKSWFILDFWGGGARFLTSDSEQLVTSDGLRFGYLPRTGGRIPY